MTVTALSFLAPLREFLLLEQAERVAESYTADKRARVLALRGAALERLVAARRVTSNVAACTLGRDAVSMLARARVAADAQFGDRDLAWPGAVAFVPDLEPDPNDGAVGDADRVRDALVENDPLYLDRLEREDVARLRVALGRAANALLGRLEARRPARIRAARWGRLAALGLVALVAGSVALRRSIGPVNIAVGKPVHASSYYPNSPVGRELVDGRPGFSYALATGIEDSPTVVIDLQGDYVIDRIAVYNRSDGWWDECLPLVVELSRDGTTYTEIGRRDEVFGFNDPWTIVAPGRTARTVRLRLARHGFLALGRVEIFGKKSKT
jgi:hypothetical protein